ncbi:MAG: class I tRNA ligase family protein, partial [Erysipelotrichaceae bacterium]|nr:class I tRNA ligase family protein [Erysipelotrichaceae bacterium]
MKELRIYNTKTLQNEVFKPLKEGEVKMYVCGPTVYGDIHIGNARPVVVFDTFRRLLEAIGYDVKYVSNYTDVDDKIIKEAKRRGITEKQLTEEMIEAFQKVRKDLNTEPLYRAPKVTETMDQIIAFIKELVDKGYAYEVNGDVYFDTTSVETYGDLSHQNIEELKVGARIDENEQKRSPLDFALWKKTDEGIKWESPFCLGRPGWHTECVVMINNELGPLIDIHGGGKDLRFPH